MWSKLCVIPVFSYKYASTKTFVAEKFYKIVLFETDIFHMFLLFFDNNISTILWTCWRDVCLFLNSN